MSQQRNIPIQKDREFEHTLVDLRRVARMVGGGRRFRFRATVVIGDKKGRVGEATAKGVDVSAAVEKAINKAKKHLIKVTLVNGTIPHDIKVKFGAAKVLLKSASVGTGLIAGGSVRIVLELAGVRNILSKMLGSHNKINNIRATLKALKSFEITTKLKRLEKEEADNQKLKIHPVK